MGDATSPGMKLPLNGMDLTRWGPMVLAEPMVLAAFTSQTRAELQSAASECP